MMTIDAVHIGMPKCASSLLQKSLLISHPDIEMVTPKYDQELRPYVNRFLSFNTADGPETFRRELRKRFRRANAVQVLSQEGFCGDMRSDQNCAVIAQSIKQLFGKVKIVLIVREQTDYLYSAYRHAVGRGELFSLSRFIRRYGEEKARAKTERPGSHLYTRLDYFRLVELYAALFGKRRLGLFFYEDLAARPREFAERLYRFLGVKQRDTAIPVINKSIDNPGPQTWLNQFSATAYNDGKFRWLPFPAAKKLGNATGRLLRPRENFRRKVLQHIPEKRLADIRESNLKLCEWSGIDLAEKGYLV